MPDDTPPPKPHPFRVRMQQKFPNPLSRSCGYPTCDQRLTIDLFDKGTGFRGDAYCPSHQPLATKRKRKLRTAIAQIDELLDARSAPDSGGNNARNAKHPGLTTQELTAWRRRLKWELDGMPNTPRES